MRNVIIYKIENENGLYIGSTSQSLKQRKRAHLIKGDLIPIYTFKCNTFTEQRMKEQEFKEKLKPNINKYECFTSKPTKLKNRRNIWNNNKDKINRGRRINYINNKDKINEKLRNKYKIDEEYKKYIRKKNKISRDKNKDKINKNRRDKIKNDEEYRNNKNERNRRKVKCECGMMSTSSHLKRHQRTQKHKDNIYYNYEIFGD